MAWTVHSTCGGEVAVAQLPLRAAARAPALGHCPFYRTHCKPIFSLKSLHFKILGPLKQTNIFGPKKADLKHLRDVFALLSLWLPRNKNRRGEGRLFKPKAHGG